MMNIVSYLILLSEIIIDATVSIVFPKNSTSMDTYAKQVFPDLAACP